MNSVSSLVREHTSLLFEEEANDAVRKKYILGFNADDMVILVPEGTKMDDCLRISWDTLSVMFDSNFGPVVVTSSDRVTEMVVDTLDCLQD